MSPYGYIQLFVFGMLCSGAISAENVTCTTPRAQRNIDMNQVYGDWFMGQVNIPANATLHKKECIMTSVKKINESTLEASTTFNGGINREVFSLENAENPRTWHVVGEDRTVEVIYLSADGTTMATAGCLAHRVEPHCILLGKQLPISSEKIEEVLHAVELAGIPRSHCQFTWKSEAICPST